jgi:hypothetical protein
MSGTGNLIALPETDHTPTVDLRPLSNEENKRESRGCGSLLQESGFSTKWQRSRSLASAESVIGRR